MKITSIKTYSVEELHKRLRNVTMLNDPEVKPYENAMIYNTYMPTCRMAPAQLYVLKSEFEKVRDLRWSLLSAANIDILQFGNGLNETVGFVEILTDSFDEMITVLPPIIEVSKEDNGEVVNIINDGMHRCFLARSSMITPTVVRIDGVPKHLPYYAYPLAGGWSSVEMVSSLEALQLKKYHRFPNGTYQKYYRNFNSAFVNVGGPRGNK